MEHYSVNADGIQAINTMAHQIVMAKDELVQAVLSVKSVADENDTIGPHQASLDDALDQISQKVNEVSDSVDLISVKLKEVAELYQEYMDDNRFKNASG